MVPPESDRPAMQTELRVPALSMVKRPPVPLLVLLLLRLHISDTEGFLDTRESSVVDFNL